MAEKTMEVTLPDGSKGLAHEVLIDQSNERWSEYTLTDGTVFRAKMNLVGVWKVDGATDPQGNPLLFINASPAVVVTSPGADLKAD